MWETCGKMWNVEMWKNTQIHKALQPIVDNDNVSNVSIMHKRHAYSSYDRRINHAYI